MKEKIIKYTLFFTLVALASCNNNRPKYFFLNFTDPISKINVSGEIKNGKENGLWAIYNEDKRLIAQGFCHNGLKIGKWIYKTLSDSIYWKNINRSKIEINLPYELLLNDKEYFNAYSEDYNFMIEQDTEMTVEEYQLFNKESVLNYKKPISIGEYRIIRPNDTCFYSCFEFSEDAQQYAIFCFFVSIDAYTYAFAFKAPNENLPYKKKIFFDILEGCYIGKRRVLDPFTYIRFERI